MIVVSNTSPITNLSAIGKLHLLQQLYGEIFISSSVFKELTQWGDSIPGATEVKTSNWIQVKSINNISLIISLVIFEFVCDSFNKLSSIYFSKFKAKFVIIYSNVIK